MKIEFIDNVPHITPETKKEEDQLFNWYEKQGQKRVDSVISFEWLPRALAKSSDELGNCNKPHVNHCNLNPKTIDLAHQIALRLLGSKEWQKLPKNEIPTIAAMIENCCG